MYFDIKLFGIHQNGRFSHCWMAATNPKLFKAFVQRGEMENIGIPILCEEMQEELKVGLVNSKSRIPLYLAAQLVYGAVRIYQQQVQFLYEKTNCLFFYQSATTRELMLKRRRISQESYYGKKKKLPVDLAQDAEEYNIELPDTGTQDVYELLCLDTQAGKAEDFLLREEENEAIVIDEDDDFGIITEVDKQFLVDMLVDSQEKSCLTKSVLRDISNKAESRKVKDKVQGNCETTPTNDSPSKIPINEPDSEIDIIREAAREEETPLLLNIPDLLDLNVSSRIDVSNLEDSTSFGLLTQPMEIVGTGADPSPTAVVVPKPPGHIDELPSVELFQSKRKRKSIKLKTDLITKIAFDTFMQQCQVNSTLRCLDPRLDVVSSFKRNFKESSRLFEMPSRNSVSKDLLKTFTRNLTKRATEIDISVLDDILAKKWANCEEIIPMVLRTEREAINSQPDLNDTNEPTAAYLPPFEITDALNTAIQADVCGLKFSFIGSENVPEDPLFLRLKDDFINDFKAPNDEQEVTTAWRSERNLCNPTELNRSQLGKEVVLKRLLYLWKNKLGPVTMKLLCHGVRRKDAAFSFYCLMELCARNYVELKRDTETNDLISIEIGPKVLQRVSE